MEFRDFSKIALSIKCCYPNHSIFPTEETVRMWYEMLKDLNYDELSIATMRHIQTSSFPPSISDLRNEYAKVIGDKAITASSWVNEWRKVCTKEYDELNSLSRFVVLSLGGTSQIEYLLEERSSNLQFLIKEFEKLYLEYEKKYISNLQLSKNVAYKKVKGDAEKLIEKGENEVQEQGIEMSRE